MASSPGSDALGGMLEDFEGSRAALEEVLTPFSCSEVVGPAAAGAPAAFAAAADAPPSPAERQGEDDSYFARLIRLEEYREAYVSNYGRVTPARQDLFFLPPNLP